MLTEEEGSRPAAVSGVTDGVSYDAPSPVAPSYSVRESAHTEASNASRRNQGRKCGGCCSCSAHTTLWLEQKDLQTLQAALQRERPVLTEDLVASAVFVAAGTPVLWIRGAAVHTTVEARELIADLVERDDTELVQVVFGKGELGYPWTWILRCPLLIVLSVFLVVVGTIAAGLRPFTPDTNFDSLFVSDGPASVQYNGILECILGDHSSEQGRRLQADDAGTLGLRASVPENLAFEEAGDVHSNGTDRRLQSRGMKLYKYYALYLIYVADDGSNAITSEHSESMHQVEDAIRNLPDFVALCRKADPKRATWCQHGVSMANFVFPTVKPDEGGSDLIPDGQGSRPVPLYVAADMVGQQEGVSNIVLPLEAQGEDIEVQGNSSCEDLDSECALWKDEGQCEPGAEHEVFMIDFCTRTCGICIPETAASADADADGTATKTRVSLVRTYFIFKTWCCWMSEGGKAEKVAVLNDEWSTVLGSVVDLLESARPNGGGEKWKNPPGLSVLYGGTSVADRETTRALQKDLAWVLGAYFFVILYGMFYLRSFILPVVGLLLNFLAVPTSLSIFMMLSNVTHVPIFMFISMFIIVGVGTDMMFVYADSWQQSAGYTKNQVHRLKFLYQHGGASTAATTFTTAMSFYANMCSVLKPLRQFGFFMGTCLAVGWLTMFLAFPPLILVSERCHSRLRRDIQRRKSSVAQGRRSSLAGSAGALLSNVAPAAQSGRDGGFTKFLSCLSRCRFLVIFLFVASVLTCGYVAITAVEQDSGVPDLFPESHNMVRAALYNEEFVDINTEQVYPITASGRTCSEIFDSGCGLLHCNTVGPRWGSEDSCACFPHTRSGMSALCPKTTIDAAVLGRRGFVTERLTEDLYLDFAEGAAGLGSAASSRVAGAASLGLVDSSSYVSMLNWETGYDSLETMHKPRRATVEDPAAAQVSFQDIAGEDVDSLQVTGSTLERNAACLSACAASSSCEFWVRELVRLDDESSQDEPSECWLRRSPTDVKANVSRVGGSRHPAGQMQFGAFNGHLIFENPVLTSLATPEEIDAACCDLCASVDECEFWDHNATGSASNICRLWNDATSYRAGSEETTRGGWTCQKPECSEQWVCYCDLHACEGTNLSAEPVTLQLAPAPVPGRRLTTEFKTPSSMQADVLLTFGIQVDVSVPFLAEASGSRYSFLPTFDMADPWAQRHTLQFTSNVPPNLSPARYSCWMSGFREWWLGQGHDWPVRESFDYGREVKRYTDGLRINDMAASGLLFFGSDNKILATYCIVYIDMSKNAHSKEALELKALWDAYAADFNANVATAASRGALQASRLWVRAEAEHEIVTSIINTLAISFSSVLIGVLVFTRSLHLALLVLSQVLCVIVCLFFCMVVVYQWEIGAIEAVSLILFIGMAVDYCLHIAHKYHSCELECFDEQPDQQEEEGVRKSATISHRDVLVRAQGSTRSARVTVQASDANLRKKSGKREPTSPSYANLVKDNPTMERLERTRYAVFHMGNAIVGSAITTIGCAMFLLPCTVQIFFKIGVVVIAVTLLAALFSLVSLPALLMTCGPSSSDCKSCLRLIGANDHHRGDMPRRRRRAQVESEAKTHRFVLNLPAQGVAVYGERCGATRTRITAKG